MKTKSLVLALFCIIAAAFIITYTTVSPITHSTEQYVRASTTHVLNQNRLDVIFPGQNLIIRTENDSNQRICYAMYEDAWLPEKKGKAYDGACYDLEGNVAGACDSESDLEIKNGTITPLNGAAMLIIAPKDFDNAVFLCSNIMPHTFYEGYKEEVCRNMNNPKECIDSVGVVGVYSDDWATHFRAWPRHACIITGRGTHFKYRINDYDIEQKQERVQADMACAEADENTIVVETRSLENGVHHIAYTAEDFSGNREETRTYTFIKTDMPHSSVSNPNFNPIIYPEKEEALGFYAFNELLINAEYTEDLTGIWYRCDEGEWHRTEVEGRFAHVRVDESLCKTTGEHTVFYFTESFGINETMNEYVFFQSTSRSSTENASISIERSGDRYSLEAHYEFNSQAGLPEDRVIVEWYENDSIIGYGKIFDVPGGSNITARFTPIDITMLLGIPVNVSITVPNEPPEARDINVSVHFKYPPVLLASGDYQDPDSTPEGSSLYRWYSNGILIGEGRELIPDSYPSELLIEYTPVDITGLPGQPFSKDISDNALIDSWLYLHALYQSNLTQCEMIRNEPLRNECLSTVDLAIRECGNRQTREKFFCLAFLKNDPKYCRYIDAEWYMINCLVFISGDPEECMDLDGDNRDSCVLEFASSTGNPGLCTSLTDPDIKKLCTALADKNPGACSSISDSSLMERCLSDSSYV